MPAYITLHMQDYKAKNYISSINKICKRNMGYKS